MESSSYTAEHKCRLCGKEFPYTDKYFRKYYKGGMWYRKHQCRSCESKQRHARAQVERRFNPDVVRERERERQRLINSYSVVYDPNNILTIGGVFSGWDVRDSARWGEEWVQGVIFRRRKDNRLYKAVAYELVEL